MAKVTFEMENIDKLAESIRKIGGVPKKYVTQASKKAMTPVLKKAIKDAPEDTGALKEGIIMVGEKSRLTSKKVYRIVFDKSMNHIFQKKAKYATHTVTYHGWSRRVKDVRQEANTSYYPISQEYGYFKKNGEKVKGKFFVGNAFEEKASGVEATIIKEVKRKIDQQIAKEGMK